MMEEVFKEEDFYRDDGGPTESFSYCHYIFYTGENTEYGPDYDQLAIVINSEYPYIRLTKKRGNSHIPCGGSLQPTTGGWFASLAESERDEHCPKIAWGFAAVFLANLRYDDGQKDYVELKDRNVVIKEYYSKYLKIYLDRHNGLKYSKITLVQKELDFLAEHETLIRVLWEKCTPLQKYSQLFEYASEAESDYESFLHRRNSEIERESDGNDNSKSISNRTIIQNGERSVYIENNTGNVTIK